MNAENNANADFCVCCDKLVPEGRMVCLFCEMNRKPIAPPTQNKPMKKLKKLFGFSKENRNEP